MTSKCSIFKTSEKNNSVTFKSINTFEKVDSNINLAIYM